MFFGIMVSLGFVFHYIQSLLHQQQFLNNRWCHWPPHHEFGRLRTKGNLLQLWWLSSPLPGLWHDRGRWCPCLQWPGSGNPVVCSNTLAAMRHLTREPQSHFSGGLPSCSNRANFYVQAGFEGPWLAESARKFWTNSLTVPISTFLSQWLWPWIDLYLQNHIILQ